MRAAGVIPIGKTNTPEFGMGSHTFNKVYGTTVNPYDVTKSAGGSSGGAGASLASGMLPIADGSDNAGSLRNPGNFNNVVGFRPTFGLVPTAPNALPFLGLLGERPARAQRLRRGAAHERDGGARSARSELPIRPTLPFFARVSSAIFAARASRGAPISAGCRSIRECAPCSTRSGERSNRSAASSRT